MADYSGGFTKTAPATGTFVSQLRAGSTKALRVWEVSCFNSTAVASSIGLIRSATVGATFTSIIPVTEDTSNGTAAEARIDTAIGTAPTISTNVYIRKIVNPATIGAGVTWVFPKGLVVPINGGLLLWNFGGSTAAAQEGYWSIGE